MNPDDLAQILDDLGQRLGPTGEYVFGLAVRQVIVSSGLWLVLSTVILAIGLGTFAIARRRYRRDPYGDSAFDWGLAGIVLVVGALVVGGSNIIPLLNPEYAAIERILGAVR